MSKSADKHERLYLSRDVRERLGEQYRVVELPEYIALFSIEDALWLELDDAQIFRNAGGKVTDDMVRSAALMTNFFDTDEIIVVNHADCGIMSAPDDAVRDGLDAQTGGLDEVAIDPSLSELNLGDADVMEWVKMTDDIDEACAGQVEYLKQSEFIPGDVSVIGYVYEVKSDQLRMSGARIADEISERRV